MKRTYQPVATKASSLLQKKPSLPEAVTLVIFGATGDLTMRKLIPALFNLQWDARLPKQFAVVAAGRRPVGLSKFRQRLADGIKQFSRTPFEQETFDQLADKITYAQIDYADPSDFASLRAHIGFDQSQNNTRLFLYYLATPPTSFVPIVAGLGENQLLTRAHANQTPQTRVIFEKPFGRDVETAVTLNKTALQYMDETQLFRMDHYLGKETVQNLLVFRFSNAIFEPIWNRRYIDHVRITATEQIGIEGRGRFYEETGIIRDVLQNHLLQILALVAMEPPASFDAEQIRDERAKVFGALRPLTTTDNNQTITLGQYDGYLQEPDVHEHSKTPTYATVTAYVDNWRWEGVPFILSCGKAAKKKSTEIEIHYAPIPLCLFQEDEVCTKLETNVLTIRIQPEEGISLRFGAKTPGEKLDVSPVNMHFDFQSGFGENQQQEAYEKLLLDCLKGQQTLFARQDEVERMWRYVAPILEGVKNGSIPLTIYPKGSIPTERDQ